MKCFCLDANVLIQAKNFAYGFDIAPSFWTWLRDEFESGTIYSSHFVYEELSHRDDTLFAWVKELKDCFIDPDENVQRTYATVVAHVQENYLKVNADKFVSGADPWVIAHGLCKKDYIVTHEKRAGQGTKQVKIPNICSHFDSTIQCIDTYQLMRKLKARL